MALASLVWEDEQIHVTRADGGHTTATTIQSEIVHLDFSQMKAVPNGTSLLTDFLDEFDADPVIARRLADARKQVGVDLTPANGAIRLSHLRLAKGMSQADLATAIGVKQGMVSLLETRKQKPTEDTIRSLASALEVSFDTLMMALANG
jgi:DNA-binding XRE family transcriptional regulator